MRRPGRPEHAAMVKVEDFFARGGLPRLRQLARQYPGVRALLRRTDPLRHHDILTVFSYIVTGSLDRTAASVWGKARVCRERAVVAAYAQRLLPGADRLTVRAGEPLPTAGLGLALPVHEPFLLAAVLVDDLRVLRWCGNTAIPTFTYSTSLYDTEVIWRRQSLS